ncbi:hypothetical protein [Amycolatopsis sp. YIM 10]|uniref:hypothetical protein n=1 Tax=Amycolatopsis sp. YIM 10 TaxID=2653857 RepID=UPI00129038F8|nr:hypothetical protein [Amycolatopsis sp. YIM 10]QFU91591.1 hypothetical protein YIM_32150 [Amycolatopsis sp. YIM 10]
MTINLTPEQVLAGLGVLLVVFLVWRRGAKKARRAAETARAGVRAISLAGRVLFLGAALVGVQWLVITHPGNTTLLLVTLAIPDLIAAHVLTRALTVVAADGTPRRGGRR